MGRKTFPQKNSAEKCLETKEKRSGIKNFIKKKMLNETNFSKTWKIHGGKNWPKGNLEAKQI